MSESNSNCFHKRLPYIHLYIFAAYILGIVVWYQYYSHLLFIPFLICPIFIFFKNKNFFSIFLLFSFFLLGNFRTSFIQKIDTGIIQGKATVYSIPRNYSYYKKALIKFEQNSKSYYLDAYFPKDSSIFLFDSFTFTGEIKTPNLYKNFDETPLFVNNYESEKYFLQIKNFSITSYNSVIKKLSLLREDMKKAILRGGGDSNLFFCELLFGEKLLSPKERRVFSDTGTAHLLSISGLHFAITVLFAFFITYLLQIVYPFFVHKIPRPFAVVFISLPLLIFYAFISGLSIPALRAFLIFALFSLFFFYKISPNALSLLSLVGLILLLFDPTLIFSKSFQMSFLAVYVLIILKQKVLEHFFLKRLQKYKFLFYFFSIAITSLTISVFLFPLTQTINSQSIVVTIFANIIAIPILSFIILPFSLIVLPLSLISDKLFSLFFLIPYTGWRVLHSYLLLIEPIANYTKFSIYFRFSSALLYFCFLISIIYLRGNIKYVLSPIIFFVLLFSFYTPQRKAFVTFLDVGQGDCALIQSDKGKIIFVDVGGNIYDPNLFNRAYRPQLALLNIKEIEAIIISHYHPDHYRVLEDFLNNYTIKHVFCPLTDANKTILNLWQKGDFQLHLVNKRTYLTIDDVHITLLPQNHFKKENDRSMWTIVDNKERSVLFTGDAEKYAITQALHQLNDFSPDIIKVPHHGAKSSFIKEFYRKLKPSFAIISVAKRNPWHLPSDELISFFKENNIKVFRTDINGQIIIDMGKKPIEIKTYQ